MLIVVWLIAHFVDNKSNKGMKTCFIMLHIFVSGKKYVYNNCLSYSMQYFFMQCLKIKSCYEATNWFLPMRLEIEGERQF
jgi:hypothetical protein